ncbi:MAG: ABC transporter permease [Clostridia bacterium]|nr:ABC transporter permease [Clostridia bacterium]
MNVKRVHAIFIKELQDIRSNLNVLAMFLIPIIFTLIYGKLIPDTPKGFGLGFGLLSLMVMVDMFVPAMLIAEEKEKKTLGVLMLSPATPLEVFTGKGLLTFVLTLVSTFVLMAIDQNNWEHLAVILSGTILTSITCMFLGMIIGLLSQNQMATGIISFPIMLPLYMLPMLSQIGETMQFLSNLTPTHHYFKILELGIDLNKGFAAILPHLGVIAGSLLMCLAVLLLVYRKRGLE